MVLKLFVNLPSCSFRFENDVEMYGAQTTARARTRGRMFENDVEMYGAQTECGRYYDVDGFENDVEMYGAQTSYDV